MKNKEEELVKKLKDSFPDMLDFNNCLKELRKFWEKQGIKKAKEDIFKSINWEKGIILGKDLDKLNQELKE
jgi:hypothetical protein